MHPGYPHHNDSYDPDPPRWWLKPLLCLLAAGVGLLGRWCSTVV